MDGCQIPFFSGKLSCASVFFSKGTFHLQLLYPIIPLGLISCYSMRNRIWRIYQTFLFLLFLHYYSSNRGRGWGVGEAASDLLKGKGTLFLSLTSDPPLPFSLPSLCLSLLPLPLFNSPLPYTVVPLACLRRRIWTYLLLHVTEWPWSEDNKSLGFTGLLFNTFEHTHD